MDKGLDIEDLEEDDWVSLPFEDAHAVDEDEDGAAEEELVYIIGEGERIGEGEGEVAREEGDGRGIGEGRLEELDCSRVA